MKLAQFLMLAGLCCSNMALGDDGVRTDSDFLSSGDVRIHYSTYGRGPNVVLIHGLTSTAEDNWGAVTTALADRYRLITFDARGHGQSEGPHAAGVYGLEMVNDVLHLMDHLALQDAHIVGYSMGGLIALRFAIDHPDRVASLIVGGQGFETDQELQTTVAGAAVLRETNSALALVPNPDLVRESVRETFMKTLAGNDALALAALMEQYAELGFSTDELRGIEVPLLAIVGTEDPALAAVQRMKSILDTTRVVRVPDETHLSTPLTAQFVSAIEQFLAQQ